MLILGLDIFLFKPDYFLNFLTKTIVTKLMITKNDIGIVVEIIMTIFSGIDFSVGTSVGTKGLISNKSLEADS